MGCPESQVNSKLGWIQNNMGKSKKKDKNDKDKKDKKKKKKDGGKGTSKKSNTTLLLAVKDLLN